MRRGSIAGSQCSGSDGQPVIKRTALDGIGKKKFKDTKDIWNNKQIMSYITRPEKREKKRRNTLLMRSIQVKKWRGAENVLCEDSLLDPSFMKKFEFGVGQPDLKRLSFQEGSLTGTLDSLRSSTQVDDTRQVVTNLKRGNTRNKSPSSLKRRTIDNLIDRSINDSSLIVFSDLDKEDLVHIGSGTPNSTTQKTRGIRPRPSTKPSKANIVEVDQKKMLEASLTSAKNSVVD